MFWQKKHKNKGFTLIEMLVSLTLFSVVVVITIGSIFTIIDSNRKSQSLSLVMNDLNFAIESMTRDIKTAEPDSLDENGDSIRYINSANEDVNYFLDSNTIKRQIGIGDPVNILSDQIVIEEFKPRLFDLYSGLQQPKMLLYIKGYVQITEKTKSDFFIQTTITPRKLNI